MLTRSGNKISSIQVFNLVLPLVVLATNHGANSEEAHGGGVILLNHMRTERLCISHILGSEIVQRIPEQDDEISENLAPFNHGHYSLVHRIFTVTYPLSTFYPGQS
ncbi:unnamed protein product [Calypogeia fissa]